MLTDPTGNNQQLVEESTPIFSFPVMPWNLLPLKQSLNLFVTPALCLVNVLLMLCHSLKRLCKAFGLTPLKVIGDVCVTLQHRLDTVEIDPTKGTRHESTVSRNDSGDN